MSKYQKLSKTCPLCLKKFKSTSELSISTKYQKHYEDCRKQILKEFYLEDSKENNGKRKKK